MRTLRRSAAQTAARVLDPEVPVLTLADLGVLRDVTEDESGRVVVTITPTYSGCPAMDAIRADIRRALEEDGYADVTIETVLSPAWTTDWISSEGRRKLREYGIAPPEPRRSSGPVSLVLGLRPPVLECPNCGSDRTRELSRFGSTACKSPWVCETCLEPFEHFKSH
jgi:ring-1,2-phenylacetyl-CoA epoxidase subunit PaaD